MSKLGNFVWGIADQLRGVYKPHQYGGVILPFTILRPGRGPDDLVFGDGSTYLPRPKSAGGWFAGAVKWAKVQPVTPHDLRHTCASLAVSSGANILALARMLGHKDPSVTLKVYADLFDDDLDVVAENLHAKFGPKNGVQPVSTAGQNGRK